MFVLVLRSYICAGSRLAASVSWICCKINWRSLSPNIRPSFGKTVPHSTRAGRTNFGSETFRVVILGHDIDGTVGTLPSRLRLVSNCENVKTNNKNKQ
jgi:hypothetical protein